ncbi:MAG: hypothetical protein C4540_02265 [Candidatus Omnitrophota bacterium]|jgi:Flp pilus assembly pilin Flp|nr:MAG: hypothetical protein C4540_02265 [Candidatus Omnitrophota bacterium]
MRKRAYARGQSTTEYAVLAALIASALIAMNVYVKRSIQGKLRDLADQIAPEEEHYHPRFTNSTYVINQSGVTVYNVSQGVSRVYQNGSEGSSPENITRSGYEETPTFIKN